MVTPCAKMEHISGYGKVFSLCLHPLDPHGPNNVGKRHSHAFEHCLNELRKAVYGALEQNIPLRLHVDIMLTMCVPFVIQLPR